MALMQIYTRLGLTLSRLDLISLYENQTTGLDDLSQDLSRLVLKKNHIEETSYSVDLKALIEYELNYDFTIAVLMQNTLDLVKRISFQVKRYSHLGRVISIHLLKPDILVIELVSPDNPEEIRKARWPNISYR